MTYLNEWSNKKCTDGDSYNARSTCVGVRSSDGVNLSTSRTHSVERPSMAGLFRAAKKGHCTEPSPAFDSGKKIESVTSATRSLSFVWSMLKATANAEIKLVPVDWTERWKSNFKTVATFLLCRFHPDYLRHIRLGFMNYTIHSLTSAKLCTPKKSYHGKWLQWQPAYSDTFAIPQGCHCKRGRLYWEKRNLLTFKMDET